MRAHNWSRLGALVGVVAVAVAAVAATAGGSPGPRLPRQAPTGDAFYRPNTLRSGRPGDVIWAAPIISPAGSRGWKMLYHSQALDGHDIAVSGVVVVPTAKAPPSGRPVISWAHGTHGLADACAPSKALDVAYRIPGIKDFIRQGDIVVATDYEGLGTPGEHPYLVGESEARGVLDIVRAVRQMPDSGASATTLVYGHSQGGQAALFAGQISPSYAPELHIAGVVAVAPVADVSAMVPMATTVPVLLGYDVMTAVGFRAAYPNVDLTAVLGPAVLSHLNVVDQRCSDDVVDFFAQYPPAQVVAHDPLDVPVLAQLLQQSTAGYVHTAAPQFIVQGDKDLLVPKTVTDRYIQRACGQGDQLVYRVYPGLDHITARDVSVPDVEAWLTARLDGQAAPSSC
ncbi:MAG TPA: lipase family protein [Acidimicrobiia bacterium]|nr:lipase family protein [Acidimicrobiia bacterium]